MAFRFLILISFIAGAVRADPATDEAVKLYAAKKYPEARAALEKIVAADPDNAKACYTLGMAIRHRRDELARDDAVGWLEKAATLEPNNPAYLADYGGTCLELADRHSSYPLATRGRDALEKSVSLDPADLDARDGLMQFYARAPWPLGDHRKALAQAEEIGRQDKRRGLRGLLWVGRRFEKAGDLNSARQAYRDAVTLDPRNQEGAQALARLK